MKLTKTLTCVVAVVLASLITNVQAQTFKQGSAHVRQIKGSAKYSVEGGGLVPLKSGATLKPGSTIQTAPESIVDLDLGANGPVIRVTPSTTVSLDKLTQAGTGIDRVIDTRVNVQNGTIVGSVTKLAKASRYEIKTPNGVAGIRGTDYVISVKPRGDGTYEVTYTDITGTLVVAARAKGNAAPETVVLNAGESWTPGSPVGPAPRQLLEFYRAQSASANRGIENAISHAAAPAIPVLEQHVSPRHGNNGVGNGIDPQPPGNPPINDGPGTGPGNPGNQGGK
ncbi:MAG: FecR domain-containing protein [Verrucomicrobiota bacterium]